MINFNLIFSLDLEGFATTLKSKTTFNSTIVFMEKDKILKYCNLTFDVKIFFCTNEFE